METPPSSPPATSPRPHSRNFSFRSDRSGGSKKEELVESPREKQQRDSVWKGISKANPNAAITEAQPGVNALFEVSTISPLRALEHRDGTGQVITDPDLSNPTRPRMERPLDTIRSFESAIDKEYSRRSSYMRAETNEQKGQYNASRRNSGYYNGFETSGNANRYGPGYGQGGGGGGYYGAAGTGPGGGGPPRMRYGPRQQSDPILYGPRTHAQPGNSQSQDTTATGYTNGSDSTGPWANSTDPSSENSSLNRGAGAMKANGDPGYGPNGYESNGYGANGYGANGYGANGYGQQGGYGQGGGGHSGQGGPPQQANYGQSGYGYGPQNGYSPAGGYGPNGFQDSIPEEGGAYSMGMPVQPPSSRRPIPLGNSQSSPNISGRLPPAARTEPEKRKSWLKRTFSKKA